jgi:hypothetical protein
VTGNLLQNPGDAVVKLKVDLERNYKETALKGLVM